MSDAKRHGPHEPVGCRFIDGDTHGAWRYCQAPQRPGSSFCPEHHARCYRPATDKEAREVRAVTRIMGGRRR